MTVMEETEFATLFDHHRRELHVHCYRMLGSFDEAEDQVQETFLRAWRSRETFAGEQFRPDDPAQLVGCYSEQR